MYSKVKGQRVNFGIFSLFFNFVKVWVTCSQRSEGEHLPHVFPSPSSRLLLLGVSNIIWKFLQATIVVFHKSKIMNFIHYA